MTEPGDTLSRHEADEVLRRAVDLHQRDSSRGDGSLALADLQRLAGEIGIPAETVQRALVEIRSEALARPTQAPGWVDRLFGPAEVAAARTVPGPRDEVAAAIDAMLRAELFRIERNLGDTIAWENPDSLLHRARRLFDVGGRLRLGIARRVTVTTQAVGDAVHVRLVADLSPRRDARVRGGIVATIGFGGVGSLVAAFLSMPIALVPVATGLAIGGAMASAGRRTFLRDATAVHNALERFLDYLERERPRI